LTLDFDLLRRRFDLPFDFLRASSGSTAGGTSTSLIGASSIGERLRSDALYSRALSRL